MNKYTVLSIVAALTIVVLGIVFFLNTISIEMGAQSIDGMRAITSFQDGFESDGAEMFSRARWTQLYTTRAQNSVEITTERVHGGSRAVRFRAVPTGEEEVSKASIIRKGFQFTTGDTVSVSGWYYIEPATDLDNVFLMDIECELCYKTSPGVRVVLKDGYLALERGKIGFRDETFTQNKERVPLGEWFKLSVTLTLGEGNAGHTQVTMDDVLIVDRRGTNMPETEIFKRLGVNLTREQIDNVEFGVTANASQVVQTVFIDDVAIAKQ
jgi:hypothetical protein